MSGRLLRRAAIVLTLVGVAVFAAANPAEAGRRKCCYYVPTGCYTCEVECCTYVCKPVCRRTKYVAVKRCCRPAACCYVRCCR